MPDIYDGINGIHLLFLAVGGQKMKIEHRETTAARQHAVTHDLRQARRLSPAPEPVCAPCCPDYTPAIGCSRYCAHVSRRLSSAPSDYPLEPQVAPLVFELKKLGVFHPCWSCEGHADFAGNIWKLPRVWFYAHSVIHLRCLGDAVNELYTARRLASRWAVVLTYSDPENLDATFSLEQESGDGGITLAALHHDLDIMAGNLETMFAQACARIINW